MLSQVVLSKLIVDLIWKEAAPCMLRIPHLPENHTESKHIARLTEMPVRQELWGRVRDSARCLGLDLSVVGAQPTEAKIRYLACEASRVLR